MILYAILSIVILGTIGSAAINAAWDASDQIVDMSNDKQLQNSYQTGKIMINSAEETKDNFAFLKSILMLSMIIGVPASIIKILQS